MALIRRACEDNREANLKTSEFGCLRPPVPAAGIERARTVDRVQDGRTGKPVHVEVGFAVSAEMRTQRARAVIARAHRAHVVAHVQQEPELEAWPAYRDEKTFL